MAEVCLDTRDTQQATTKQAPEPGPELTVAKGEDTAPALVFEGVRKTHGMPGTRRPTIAGANFAVDAGELVLLTGPSGAGKTTLLQMVLGLEHPDEGAVRVAGRPVHRLTTASLPYLRRNIGFVFQDLRLLPGQSVVDNVRLAVEITASSTAELDARVGAALDLVQIDRRDHLRPVGSLTRDVQQRVAIARALAPSPAIVLADEPTSELDGHHARAALDLLAHAAEAGGAAVLIASRSPLVAGYVRAGRVLRIEDDRVVRSVTRTVIQEFETARASSAVPEAAARALWTPRASAGAQPARPETRA